MNELGPGKFRTSVENGIEQTCTQTSTSCSSGIATN